MGERDRRAEIARLNDLFRSTGQGGEVFMTQGIGALPMLERLHILAAAEASMPSRPITTRTANMTAQC